MAQLAQRLGFDLADALAGDREVLADFLERVLAAVLKAEAHFDNFFLARAQRLEHFRGLLAQIQVDDRLGGRNHAAVDDEIAQVRLLLLADRCFKRDRLLRDAQHLADFADGQLHFDGKLLGGRLASQILLQLALHADQLVDGFDHVDRDTNGPRLIGDGAGDRLPHPPGGVGGKFVAALIIEFIDGLHQADVAFLNQIEELQAAIGVALGDGDDQPEIGLDELFFGDLGFLLASFDDLPSAAELGRARAGFLLELRNALAVLAHLLAHGRGAAVGAVARRFQLALDAGDFALDRLQFLDGAAQASGESAARGGAEMNFANEAGDVDHRPRQAPAQGPMHLGLHAARNGLQFLPELLSLFVMLFDFRDGGGELIGLLDDAFVGDDQIRHDQDVANGRGIARQDLVERENFANHQRRSRKGLAHGGLPTLDALGQLDFALAGEQRHGAHLAQVHADGIVGFIAEILGEIEVAQLLAFLDFLVEFELGLLENFDAGAIELRQQIVEFAAAGIIFGEKLVDFVIENVALLFSGVHQLLQPAEFVVNRHNTPGLATFFSALRIPILRSAEPITLSVQHVPRRWPAIRLLQARRVSGFSPIPR